MDEKQKYKLAKKRVKQKKIFYRHLSVYLVMGGFFFLINYFADPYEWWFFWPMLPWGVGLSMHYLKVFGLTAAGLGTSEWEERELDKEMKRLGVSAPYPLKAEDDSGSDELNLDEHLQLKEMKKEAADNYDKEDFV